MKKGWGLFLFRRETGSNVIVEAPHPLYDQQTPSVAMSVYSALDARALLIAGAHRDANGDGAADAAHNPETAFQAIHSALVSSGSPVVLQFHSFAASKHPGFPQVVLDGDHVVAPGRVETLRTVSHWSSARSGWNTPIVGYCWRARPRPR